jgi:hypothetical protein
MEELIDVKSNDKDSTLVLEENLGAYLEKIIKQD